MTSERRWAWVSPEFGPGDLVYTSWGEQLVVERVEVTMIVTYITKNNTVWQADELRAEPDQDQVCALCGQLPLFRDELGSLVCESCRKL